MCAEICEALCMGWIVSWWYNSTLGQNCCLCCDKCCRCRFLDDDGPLPDEENHRPQRAHGTTRAELEGDQGGESLPRYEENTGMKMAQPGGPQASMPPNAPGQAEVGRSE